MEKVGMDKTGRHQAPILSSYGERPIVSAPLDQLLPTEAHQAATGQQHSSEDDNIDRGQQGGCGIVPHGPRVETPPRAAGSMTGAAIAKDGCDPFLVDRELRPTFP